MGHDDRRENRRTGLPVLLARMGSAVIALAGVLSLTMAHADPETGCPRDPYPCGGEWPADLADADDFALDRVEEMRIPMDDGLTLNAWIAFPDVPDGVRVPTLLSSSPYYDTVLAAPPNVYRHPATPIAADVSGAQSWWADSVPVPNDVDTHSAGFPPIRLIRKGYALAYVNVRGTGMSDGCFDPASAQDQADQVSIIEWIADQGWSNGRVGMVGGSYPAWYTWQAAVQAPEALKAIVTAGDLIDIYQWVNTPQGANSAALSAYFGQLNLQLATAGGTGGGRTSLPDRVGCDPTELLLRPEMASYATGDRDADYFIPRTLSDRLGDVTAAVLDTSGYYDFAGHAAQDSALWGSLDPKTPKVQIRGWWGHAHPTSWNPWGTRLDFPSGEVDWEQFVTAWFDYWLKGIGPGPRTDVVYHQDQNLQWHEARSWSPEPAKKEVLYLSQSGLATEASNGDVTFRAAPGPLDAQWIEQAAKSLVGGSPGEPDDQAVNAALCPTPAGEGLRHVYESAATTEPVLIAGNPFAYVNLSSDEPGGVVTVSMYDVAPTFACTGPHQTGARYLASGAADLNFYETPYLARAFPVDTPTRIRIDLTDVTYELAAGHKLVVMVSSGGPYERTGSTYTPNITIHGSRDRRAALASHVVVPVAAGTLGGSHPSVQYPQRPFTPHHYRE